MGIVQVIILLAAFNTLLLHSQDENTQAMQGIVYPFECIESKFESSVIMAGLELYSLLQMTISCRNYLLNLEGFDAKSGLWQVIQDV